jgi:hypothetical protein
MPWAKTIAGLTGPAPAQVSPNNRGSHSPFVMSDPADPIDRLSGAPARKLRALREIRNAARASLTEIVERQNAQQQTRFEAERTLASIIRQNNMVHDSEHPALVQQRDRIARASRELENLEPFCASRTAVSDAVGGLVSKIENWLGEIPNGVAITAFDGPPPPKLGKSPPAQTIERCRSEIVSLREECRSRYFVCAFRKGPTCLG